MYYDYLLRFDTEAEGMAVLYTDDEPNYYATDIIGTIYEPIRVTVGTATLTAGQAVITVSYVQRADNGAQNPVSA